jgi:hypothetical protein
MDALVYQLLSDQVWMLERLAGAHAETDELLRRSVICAFEAIQAQRSTLGVKDWRKLSAILTELADVMPDEQFVYSGIAIPSGRVDVDLRPFLREIRDKKHEGLA